MRSAPANGRGKAIDKDTHDTDEMREMQDRRDTRDEVSRRRTAWEERYVLDTAGNVASWMSPEVQFEEAELDRFYRSVLDSLEPRARLAFLMVRELGLSYDEVATQLGIATALVHEHVSGVERRFREELKQVDVEAPVAPKAAVSVEGRPALRLIRGGLRERTPRLSDLRGAA